MVFHEIGRCVGETISFRGKEGGIGTGSPTSLEDVFGIDRAERKWAWKRSGEVAAA